MQYLEYEIFVPNYTADGTPYPEEKLNTFKKRLVDFFGGLTDTKHRNEGLWRLAGVNVRDEIIIWKVMSNQGPKGDEFIRNIKADLESELQQDEILVICRDIRKI